MTRGWLKHATDFVTSQQETSGGHGYSTTHPGDSAPTLPHGCTKSSSRRYAQLRNSGGCWNCPDMLLTTAPAVGEEFLPGQGYLRERLPWRTRWEKEMFEVGELWRPFFFPEGLRLSKKLDFWRNLLLKSVVMLTTMPFFFIHVWSSSS